MMNSTLQAATEEPEIPEGATLAIDDGRREIVAGEIYALRFPAGQYGIIRVDTVLTRKAGEATDFGRARVIGQLVDWWEEPVTKHWGAKRLFEKFAASMGLVAGAFI